MRAGRRDKNLRRPQHRANGFMKTWPGEGTFFQWARKEEEQPEESHWEWRVRGHPGVHLAHTVGFLEKQE